MQKLSQWIRTSTGGVPENIGGGYRLNGTALNTWEDTFFIAPFAVAAMTGSTAADQTWLNSLYSYIRQSHNTDDYYADAVTLQSLLAVTGNFWDPMTVLKPSHSPATTTATARSMWTTTTPGEPPSAQRPRPPSTATAMASSTPGTTRSGETISEPEAARLVRVQRSNVPEPTSCGIALAAALLSAAFVRLGRRESFHP